MATLPPTTFHWRLPVYPFADHNVTLDCCKCQVSTTSERFDTVFKLREQHIRALTYAIDMGVNVACQMLLVQTFT